MKYTIHFLKLAQDDLKEILSYLSQFSPSTARNFPADLRSRIDLLKSMPLMCEQYHDDPFYRKMIVGDYLVFYHVDDGERVVEIHRILHGS
jgi:plasmid stabilization system protein ParE